MSGVAWAVVAAAVTLGVLLIDLAAYLRRGVDGTLSRAVRRANQIWPMAGVALGVVIGALLGHFFW